MSCVGGAFWVTARTRQKMFIITVRDTGIGIPKNEQVRLFERFFRAQNARRVAPNGTGLGLYIVKTLLTVMNGSIRCESEEGKGSQFTVEIPLVKRVPLKTKHRKA